MGTLRKIRLLVFVLSLNLTAPVAAGPLEDGLTAYDRGDYATAMRLFRPLANHGNAEAQNNVGVMYEKGQGVSQNHTEAVKWYRKAANQGNALAQSNLADLYARFPALRKQPDIGTQGAPVASSRAQPKLGKTTDATTAAALKKAEAAMGNDNGTAYSIFLALANQGNAEAQVNLGSMLSEDWGIPKDYATAITLFRRAADQGNVSAALHIGGMYGDGKGVSKDYAHAVVWYRKAAEKGDPLTQSLAQMGLAKTYAEGGYGVSQDYVEAYKWYDIAAAHKTSLDFTKNFSNGCPTDSFLACGAALMRDSLAAKMTLAQINEAKRLAREWSPRAPTPAE
jgi:uncharacterized protein